MSSTSTFLIYLAVMAGVTYLIRAVPFAMFTKEITNPRFKLFLDYIPYTVLAAMTFPAILYATSSILSAAIGLGVAILLGLRGKSLLTVAVTSCVVVYLVELLMRSLAG